MYRTTAMRHAAVAMIKTTTSASSTDECPAVDPPSSQGSTPEGHAANKRWPGWLHIARLCAGYLASAADRLVRGRCHLSAPASCCVDEEDGRRGGRIGARTRTPRDLRSRAPAAMAMS